MKLQAVTEERGISVDSSVHDDLLQIMQDNAEAVCEAHPPGTFGHVFWETQMGPVMVRFGGASTFIICPARHISDKGNWYCQVSSSAYK